MQTAADRIRIFRRELGVSQATFGALAGVSKQAVSQWEKGDTTPHWDALHALQRAHGLNPYWILNGSDPMVEARPSHPAHIDGEVIRPRLPAPESGGPDIGALMAAASPRSRSALERIAQAADAGRLTEADIALLDQIARHIEGRGLT